MRLIQSSIYPECPKKELVSKILIPMNKRFYKCWRFKRFQQPPSYRMPFIPSKYSILKECTCGDDGRVITIEIWGSKTLRDVNRGRQITTAGLGFLHLKDY